MISSILIIAFSVVLLVYWFRYTCLLILRTRTAVDYAPVVVTANNLQFPHVQRRIGEAEAATLDPLRKSLDRDYSLLTYLMKHSAGFHVGGITVEQRMLLLDFKVMQIWYRATRRLAVHQARAALDEMSNILGHLANAIGERAAGISRA